MEVDPAVAEELVVVFDVVTLVEEAFVDVVLETVLDLVEVLKVVLVVLALTEVLLVAVVAVVLAVPGMH